METNKLHIPRPNAWLLEFGSGLAAAVGTRVLLQVADNPRLLPVPCTPPHCRSVFSWGGRLLPVMDMAALLGAAPLAPRLLVVACWRETPDAAPAFGAFLLAAPPVAITVGNDQACPLPEHPAAWSAYAASCFGHRGDAIPVLHLPRIFAPAA